MGWKLPPYSVEQVLVAQSQVVDWGVRALGVPELWRKTRGKGVRVAVLDTGAPDHPDLAGAVLEARDFTGSRYGSRDVQGHSTHCCGILAARDNATGVVGVAPEASLLIAKVLGDGGSGSSAAVAAGVRWAAERGADVISMSLGSQAPDESIRSAIRDAVGRNVVVVVAAGNDGPDPGSVDYPGRWPEAVAVASYNEAGRISDFSSRGAEVDVAAPGEHITSTYLNGTLAKLSGTCLAKGSYVYGPGGPKRIEDVNAGDVVFAFKGGRVVERVVYANHYRGRAEVHQLRAGGRDVLATATHQMLVVDEKGRDLDWVPLGSLKPHHKLLLPRQLPTQVNPYLDATLSEDLCFLLGFFAGDGWLTETNRARRVSFATGDSTEIIARVAAIYEREFGKQMRQAKNGGWHYDDSTRAAMIIEALGLNAPAAEKTIPLWVWTLSRAKQLAFYKGYRTADGHVYKNPSYRRLPDAFECSSGDLVRRFAAFADYHGWQHSTVSSRTRMQLAPSSKVERPSTSHCLKVIRESPVGGWNGLRGGGSPKRKPGEQTAREMGIDTAGLWAAHWRVDDCKGLQDVYDLTVPDADCFVTQGVITHNSMATPFAAGVIALLLAARAPAKLSAAEVLSRIKETSADIGSPGFDPASGWGLIDPKKLVIDAPAATPTLPVTHTLTFSGSFTLDGKVYG